MTREEIRLDKIHEVVQHVLRTQYEHLPPGVIEKTRESFIDTIGVSLAGSTAPGCREVVEQVKYWGGREESSLLVYGGKVPSPSAALANSMLAHARDFDDDHEEGSVHPSISVIPAAMAIAEEMGGVDGKTFITALAIGVDLVCRLALTIRVLQGWHLSGICGGIGAAATAGKLLRLSEDQLWNALGIAYAQTTGNLQGGHDGAMTKRMNPGFASKAAVLSVYLARRGVTGARNVMEGEEGFFTMFDGGQRFDPEKLRVKMDGTPYGHDELTRDLGKVFKGEEISFKPFPCCRFLHAPIDATLKNVRENNIQPEEVERVTVRACKRATRMYNRPMDQPDRAQIAAQFSIPYGVAAAIVRRHVKLEDFEKEAVGDLRVLEMSRRVEVVVNPEALLKVPVIVEITTKQGKTCSTQVREMIGSPQKPLTPEELRQKFYDCSKYSARPIPPRNLDHFLEKAGHLEGAGDVRELIHLFT